MQNEILFGYNREDTLTAEQVFIDGYGQCNTKTTLLMALLRGVNIPCRVHGFEVSKKFQRGATTAFISAWVPKRIIHTWAEVYYNGQWLALEGVITDKKYFEAVKSKYQHVSMDSNVLRLQQMTCQHFPLIGMAIALLFRVRRLYLIWVYFQILIFFLASTINICVL